MRTKRRLLDRKQAAAAAGVTIQTLDAWRRKGIVKPCAFTLSGRPRFDADKLMKEAT